MRRTLISLFACLAAVAAAGTAFAAGRLEVAIDHSERLQVRGAAGSVIVGNPEVADVTVVDAHTLFVSGRGFGVTQIVVVDPLGRTLWQGDVVVTSPETNAVSVWRGAAQTEMACASTCQPLSRAAKTAGKP